MKIATALQELSARIASRQQAPIEHPPRQDDRPQFQPGRAWVDRHAPNPLHWQPSPDAYRVARGLVATSRADRATLIVNRAAFVRLLDACIDAELALDLAQVVRGAGE